MDRPADSVLEELIGAGTLDIWRDLTGRVDSLYDVDRIWNKGFGDWTYEYKYRRGGKTLCAFYAKPGTANILIILGKSEREKFEEQRGSFSEHILSLYDTTESYHDGKWLWIPIDEALSSDDIIQMLMFKRKLNRKES